MGGWKALRGVLPAALICGGVVRRVAVFRLQLCRRGAGGHHQFAGGHRFAGDSVEALEAEGYVPPGRASPSEASGAAQAQRERTVLGVDAVPAAGRLRSDLGPGGGQGEAERLHDQHPVAGTAQSGGTNPADGGHSRRRTRPSTRSAGSRPPARPAFSRRSWRRRCCGFRREVYGDRRTDLRAIGEAAADHRDRSRRWRF